MIKNMLEFIRHEQLEEAILVAESRLKKNDEDLDAHYAKGIALLLGGDYPAAITSLEKVIHSRQHDAKCLANLGVAFLRLGELDNAISALNRSLTIKPDYTEAVYNLACAYIESKQLDHALKHFKQLAQTLPDVPDYHCCVGDVYRLRGQHSHAIRAYQKTIKIAPDFLRAHSNISLLLMHIGELDQALVHCERAVALDANDAVLRLLGDCYVLHEQLDDAMNAYADAFDARDDCAELCIAIGKVWQEIGDTEEASSWFEKAILHDQDNITAKCYLAKIIADAGSTEDALAILQPLVVDAPDHIELNLCLSEAYWLDGDAMAAMQCLEHVRELTPQRLQVLIKIAAILNSSGDTHGAIALYQEALCINPHFVPALNGLATSKNGQLSEVQVDKMLTMLGDKQRVSLSKKASLHNGLAYFYDACCHRAAGDSGVIKEYAKKASEHMLAANQAQWDFRSRRDWQYDMAVREAFISNVIGTFTRDYFQRYESHGLISTSNDGKNVDVTPVFIVAMPRSGTTLTEQILARHSAILGVGERPFAHQSFHAFCRKDDTDFSEQYLQRLTEKNVKDMALHYLSKLQSLIDKSAKQGVRYVVDKMPDNYAMVGWILTLFPQAKIIHAERDARDVALSCWMTQFASIPWACQESHLVHRVQQYQRLMAHWQEVLGDRIYHSSYESLVVDQEACSKALLAFIGVDWEPQCLRFYESDRLVRTASITQVRQPIYQQSMAKWLRYKPYIPQIFERLTP